MLNLSLDIKPIYQIGLKQTMQVIKKENFVTGYQVVMGIKCRIQNQCLLCWQDQLLIKRSLSILVQ